jgi:hypothetical protein
MYQIFCEYPQLHSTPLPCLNLHAAPASAVHQKTYPPITRSLKVISNQQLGINRQELLLRRRTLPKNARGVSMLSIFEATPPVEMRRIERKGRRAMRRVRLKRRMLRWVSIKTFKSDTNLPLSERLSTKWTSFAYAFYGQPSVVYDKNGRRGHAFPCGKKNCSHKVIRYLESKDGSSTSNMIKHARTCWGADAVNAAREAKDLAEARESVVNKYYQKDGTITASFQVKGKGKITYRHKQHSRSETR